MEFLLFPLLWLVITCMLSFGGWQQLATHYRATTLPLTANTSTLGYAKVGWVSYKNILRAGACSGARPKSLLSLPLLSPALAYPLVRIGQCADAQRLLEYDLQPHHPHE
jgi:hypothetical protein